MVKDLEVRKDEKEPIVQEPKSEQYKRLKGLIDGYKVQNPVKYELKKEALKARLDALKG